MTFFYYSQNLQAHVGIPDIPPKFGRVVADAILKL